MIDKKWYITVRMLKRMDACYAQQETFKTVFPSRRARITLANVTKAFRCGLNVWWLVCYSTNDEIAQKCKDKINEAYEKLNRLYTKQEYQALYCQAIYDALCEQINTEGELDLQEAPF